jgi:hypothetical protein
MVGPAPFEPYTFRALAKTFGTMWLRCDVCRRYGRLQLAGLHDIGLRLDEGCSVMRSQQTTTFSLATSDLF